MHGHDNTAGPPIELASEVDTEKLGRAIAEIVEPGTVIGLIGGLGAGKTRLVRAIAESLGVDPDEISSPTFVLIHEYDGQMPIYHFDVYRLKTAAAFEDLGPDDYWDAGGLCLVEWADRVPDLMPHDAWTIVIESVPESGTSTRRVWINPPSIQEQIARRLA